MIYLLEYFIQIVLVYTFCKEHSAYSKSVWFSHCAPVLVWRKIICHENASSQRYTNWFVLSVPWPLVRGFWIFFNVLLWWCQWMKRDKKYTYIQQIVHGTEGHMAVYGPVRHQKKYYMDRSFWGPFNIFGWRTGPYTAIWPEVTWTICYIILFI